MKGRGRRLDAGYFRKSPEECARGLIGCLFEWDGCAGVIVETEAYAAEGDEACHTAFRPSAREFVRHYLEGTAYVYLNYGVHWMFNVLVKGPAGDGFVLFRALEPVAGEGCMAERRRVKGSEELCSGPGKLTRALGIGGSVHGEKFLEESGRGIWCGDGERRVASGPRIGISREKELPWRFAAMGSKCLSRPAGKWCG